MHGRFSIIGGTCPGCRPKSTPMARCSGGLPFQAKGPFTAKDKAGLTRWTKRSKRSVERKGQADVEERLELKVGDIWGKVKLRFGDPEEYLILNIGIGMYLSRREVSLQFLGQPNEYFFYHSFLCRPTTSVEVVAERKRATDTDYSKGAGA